MKIPKTFQIFGQEIQVEWRTDLTAEASDVGLTIFEENRIILQKSTEPFPRAQSKIEDTFCHEITHLILDSIGEHELSQREPFVEMFSHALYQVLISGVCE